MAKYRASECRENETFVGNRHKDESLDDLVGVRTLRTGNVALDIDGHVLPDYRPLFIDRHDESYDRIMMARFGAIRGGR